MTELPTPAEFQDEILAVLGPNGEHWFQGAASNHGNTKLCVLAAAQHARRNFSVKKRIPDTCSAEDGTLWMMYMTFIDTMREVAIEQFPDRGQPEDPSFITAATVNDHPATRFPDVVGIIEKTRARLEERITP